MSIVVSLSLLSGIVLGLRFNVRSVFALCLVVMVGGIGAALGGFAAVGDAALFAVSVTVALQVGYFVSMVIGAMHLAETPNETTTARNEAREGFEMPRM
ncbi:MAG: hypothetical protein OEL76_13395 [Siculibacillus sp.]|nr:hypothetical protein [Siculibacillus sp.]